MKTDQTVVQLGIKQLRIQMLSGMLQIQLDIVRSDPCTEYFRAFLGHRASYSPKKLWSVPIIKLLGILKVDTVIWLKMTV